MPRTARASVGGLGYHVINRGNGRRRVFRNDGDYQAFLTTIAHACVEIPMPVLTFCLMLNIFYGSPSWTDVTVECLDLQSSLRPRELQKAHNKHECFLSNFLGKKKRRKSAAVQGR